MVRSLSLASILAVLLTAAAVSQTRTPASQLRIEETTAAPVLSAQLFALVNGRLFAVVIGSGLTLNPLAGGALELRASAPPPILATATRNADGTWTPSPPRPPGALVILKRNGVENYEGEDYAWTPEGKIKPLHEWDTGPEEKIRLRYYQ